MDQLKHPPATKEARRVLERRRLDMETAIMNESEELEAEEREQDRLLLYLDDAEFRHLEYCYRWALRTVLFLGVLHLINAVILAAVLS